MLREHEEREVDAFVLRTKIVLEIFCDQSFGIEGLRAVKSKLEETGRGVESNYGAGWACFYQYEGTDEEVERR